MFAAGVFFMKTEERERVGAFIKHVREKKSIKQCTLALAMGISSAQLSRIEHGKCEISFSQLIDICELLLIDLDVCIKGRDKVVKFSWCCEYFKIRAGNK
ncbi:XRE family transcriptional regulator [Marinomonas agarivorans]|nr:XRE family transcriptional regulator [Marinomonas agarivorans]